MDAVAVLEDGIDWLGQRVARVRAEDLDRPTPCPVWTVRELLNHTLGSVDEFGATVAGIGDPTRLDAQRLAEEDTVGVDPAGAFARVAATALARWHGDGVLERSCALPFGSVPGALVAGMSASDAVVHGWDLSRALGEHADIPDRLAEPLLEFTRGLVDDRLRDGGAFGPAVEVDPATASASDRLVAFLGRRPGRDG